MKSKDAPSAVPGPRAGFEIEAPAVKDFVNLLSARCSDHAADDAPLCRRAVFVTELFERRGASHGIPYVIRYVIASFVYGEDLVSYKVATSEGMEIPNSPDSQKPRERQRQVFEEVKTRIEERVRGLEACADLPVLEGFLYHAGIRPRPG